MRAGPVLPQLFLCKLRRTEEESRQNMSMEETDSCSCTFLSPTEEERGGGGDGVVEAAGRRISVLLPHLALLRRCCDAR